MSTPLQTMSVTRTADGSADPALDQSWSDGEKVAWRIALAEHDTGINIRAVVHEDQHGWNLIVGRTSFVEPDLWSVFSCLSHFTMGAREVRPVVLSEVGRKLVEFSDERLPKGPREAAFWDAACYVVEQMGDGEWRGQQEALCEMPR